MKKIISSILYFSLTVFLGLLVTACGSTRSAHQKAIYKGQIGFNKSYRVGLLLSLTGPAARIGDNQLRKIVRYIDQVNSKAGINGYKLYILGPFRAYPFSKKDKDYAKHATIGAFDKTGQLTGSNLGGGGKYFLKFYDALVYDTFDYSNKSKAAECVNYLVQKNVLAILGPSLSSETFQLIPIVQKAKIPLISFGKNPGITHPPKDWVFAAEPIAAIAALVDALRTGGANREKIRYYLEKRLRDSGR